MKRSIRRRATQTFTLALATFAITSAWSATALAGPIDDPALPPARAQPVSSPPDLRTPVVVRNAPPVDGSSDALPIALSGTALLVALASAGFIVIAGRRMRPPSQPVKP